MEEHGWNLDDINQMIPFERQIYLDMLIDKIESDTQKLGK